MGTTKQITNHQLGTALASIIEKSGKAQQELLSTQQRLLENVQNIEKSIELKIQRLERLDIVPDLSALRSLDQQIKDSTHNVSTKIKKSLNGFILGKTIIALWLISILVFIGISVYSILEVQKAREEVGLRKNFSDRAFQFFQQNPKIYEAFKKEKK